MPVKATYSQLELINAKKYWNMLTKMGLIVRMHKIIVENNKKQHKYLDYVYVKEGKNNSAIIKHK